MIRRLKDFIRTRPRQFDKLRAARRALRVGYDPTYDFLDCLSRTRRGRISFIQVGANDGLRNDPVREFIIRDRWQGILVEPLPSVFAMLQRNYAYARNPGLKFVNAAITAEDGEALTFYTVDEVFLKTLPLERQLDLLRKASFDRAHVLRHFGEGRADAIRAASVPCMTMDKLLHDHWDGTGIDLLVIDAEGHEPAIIGSLDFEAFRPSAILFESHNLGSTRDRLYRLLNDSGYRIIPLGPDAAAVQDDAVA